MCVRLRVWKEEGCGKKGMCGDRMFFEIGGIWKEENVCVEIVYLEGGGCGVCVFVEIALEIV